MCLAYSCPLCNTSATCHMNKGKQSNKSYEASWGFQGGSHEASSGAHEVSCGVHGGSHEAAWGSHEAAWGVHENLTGVSWGPQGLMKFHWGFMGTL